MQDGPSAVWRKCYEVYGSRKLWEAARRSGIDIGRDQTRRRSSRTSCSSSVTRSTSAVVIPGRTPFVDVGRMASHSLEERLSGRSSQRASQSLDEAELSVHNATQLIVYR
jgi:hypothetical protein